VQLWKRGSRASAADPGASAVLAPTAAFSAQARSPEIPAVRPSSATAVISMTRTFSLPPWSTTSRRVGGVEHNGTFDTRHAARQFGKEWRRVSGRQDWRAYNPDSPSRAFVGVESARVARAGDLEGVLDPSSTALSGRARPIARSGGAPAWSPASAAARPTSGLAASYAD